mmetsp:Transcript_24633/g.80517  ORF Transcript_24633/g.80517 Transcript_24633/m.80517 type:complete len:128 (+) Transcript_24633:355-738(+)
MQRNHLGAVGTGAVETEEGATEAEATAAEAREEEAGAAAGKEEVVMAAEVTEEAATAAAEDAAEAGWEAAGSAGADTTEGGDSPSAHRRCSKPRCCSACCPWQRWRELSASWSQTRRNEEPASRDQA